MSQKRSRRWRAGEAFSLASDLVIRKVVVASDCLSVMKNLKEGTRGCYAHVIQEIKCNSARRCSVDADEEKLWCMWCAGDLDASVSQV